MATFLDTGLLEVFSAVFMFLLVYSIVWGILSKTKPFGDNTGVYSLIALALSFFVLLSAPARQYIAFVAPWFLVLTILFFLIIVSVSTFADVNWMKVLENDTARTWIIILVAVVALLGLAFSFGQGALESGGTVPVQNPETQEVRPVGPSGGQGPSGATASGDFEANLVNTIFHPKVLGLMLIFLLSTFVIYFLSRPSGN